MKRPSVLTRARIALEVYRHGYPERSLKAVSPFRWGPSLEGKPLWHLIDYETYCR